MSLRLRAAMVGIASAVLVIVLTMAATNRQSPGPVSAGHARIAEIAGGEACAQCHGGWFGDMQAACYECHQEISDQLDSGNGLHGSLADGVGGRCASCHGEHHGAGFRLVNRLAFAQAGVPDVQQFDHKIIGFELRGAHTELDCTQCHEHADADVLPDGAKRYLGLQRDCASCHPDPHAGQMQSACSTCHTQEDFTERHVVGHRRFLALEGVHGEAECRDCHEAGTAHALERMHARPAGAERQCADCHDSPHSDAFVAGNAAADERTPAAGCVECHTEQHTSFDDERLTIDGFQHAQSGFALGEPHDELACTACHAPEGSFAERHPGRSADDCRICHGDPHGGQFEGSALAEEGCVSCHERTHFTPHGFGAEDHAYTALPLDGAHAKQDCDACHKRASERHARVFRGTPNQCDQCHDDAHMGAFAHKQVELEASPRGACAVCHGTDAWAAIDHERFDHRDWTGFHLDGAHGQIDCTDCHARTAEPDGLGRRFGRIPEHSGATTGVGCQRCHGDPHEGQFAREGVAQEVDGRVGCLRCHNTSSFRALPHGFDHTAFTGFELFGKHADLDCAACHEPLSQPDASGRTWSRAKGQECADCHTDPHRDQFARFGKTDCTRCHKSVNTFATLSFRHNLDSRFQLGDQHRKVACALCHKQETAQGETFVRYKPLPTKCVDCHGREEGGAPRRRRRR
ncbi:MAG: cytochrome c3 family protein [Planctomycetota bacterium]